jgi:hypothetical protein
MPNPERITSLEFKPDLEEASEHWLAFWAGEIIDRPCCSIRSPKEGAEAVGGPPYMAGAREDFGPIVEQAIASAACVYWAGDSIPVYTPSFGPDQMAAWLGADLHFPEENYGTNWVEPCVEDWEQALPITLDQENRLWRRMLDFCAALAEGMRGKMVISHVDLHSNLDTLAAMRGARVYMDLMDVPETIDRAMADVRAAYAPIYDAIYDAAEMAATGTLGWVNAYHPVRTNTIQCDAAALIGPEHFKRWVKPALAEEAAYLCHCVYHLDGPECLVHLDDLLSIDGLDCIQWTTGARNKAFIEWMDLLKYIQSKGKSLWIPCGAEDMKVYHKELTPELLFYDMWVGSQKEAADVLKWLVDNT